MATAAENLLGVIATAKENQTQATGALAQVAGALEAAQAAFAQSGGQDKIALLGAMAGKCQLAQGAAQETLVAIDEMLHLAGAVHGQTGLVPIAGGGYDVHPAARAKDRGPPRPGQAPRDPPTPLEARRQFFDAALTEEKILDILRRLPRKESRDGTKTRGIWVDQDGTEREIVSGEHDLAYEAARQYWRTIFDELVPEGTPRAWGGVESNAHVEVKAIIEMYEDQKAHGSVVINNPNGPCDGEFGCKEVMEKYLRKGQTFTIFWPGGSMIVEGKA